MNAMDFLPVDIVGAGLRARLAPARLAHRADRGREHHLRARALGVAADDRFSHQGEGPGRLDPRAVLRAVRLATRCCGRSNFLFNLVEYVSKPLSHSLRLFGNMYAGEIIFLLLWLWAATGLVGTRLRRRARPGLGDLPHPDRRAAGLHLHDAHRRLHRDGARAPLDSSQRHRTQQKGKQRWKNFKCSP